MEAFPDLAGLPDDELNGMIEELEREEESISLRRRMLHGRIDILRAEHRVRLSESLHEGAVPSDAGGPHRALFEGTGDVPPEHDLGPMPDLATITDEELRATIRELEVEEDDVSLRRRVLQGRIDLLRAERTTRTREGELDLDALAKVLASGPPKDAGTA